MCICQQPTSFAQSVAQFLSLHRIWWFAGGDDGDDHDSDGDGDGDDRDSDGDGDGDSDGHDSDGDNDFLNQHLTALCASSIARIKVVPDLGWPPVNDDDYEDVIS